MDVVFNSQFFKRLREIFEAAVASIKDSSPLAVGLGVILVIVIIIQQLILIFFPVLH